MKIKIVLFLMMFAIIISSFVVSSSAAVEVGGIAPPDLAGTSWTFKDTASVTAGYGKFTLPVSDTNGDMWYSIFDIGYWWTSSDGESWYEEPKDGYISVGTLQTIVPSFSGTITFGEGEDSNNLTLRSWVGNNMNFVSTSDPEEETFMFNAGYFKKESSPTYTSVPEASVSYTSLNIPSGSKIYFNDDYTGQFIYDIGYRTSSVSNNLYSTTVGYRIADGLSYTEAFTIYMTAGGVSIESANNFYCFYFPEAFEVTELEALFLSGCLEETSQPVEPEEPGEPDVTYVDIPSGYYGQNSNPSYTQLEPSDYNYISLPDGCQFFLTSVIDGRSQFDIYDICYITVDANETVYTDICYRETSDSDAVPFIRLALFNDVVQILSMNNFRAIYLSDTLSVTSEEAMLLSGALMSVSQPEDLIALSSGYWQSDTNLSTVNLPSGDEVLMIPCPSGSRIYFNQYVDGLYYKEITAIGYTFDEYVSENDWTIAVVYHTAAGFIQSAFVLDCVGGYISKENIVPFSQFYFSSDLSGNNEVIYFLASVLEPSTSAPGEPIPPYEDNPFYDILMMIIEALQAPLFGYFSAWDVFCTICGIFVCVWLLKLLAGG